VYARPSTLVPAIAGQVIDGRAYTFLIRKTVDNITKIIYCMYYIILHNILIELVQALVLKKSRPGTGLSENR
jgi:hypothetical protein